jgi:hypothetical protein
MTNGLTLLRRTCQVMGDLDGAPSSGLLILSLMVGFGDSLKLIDCDRYCKQGKSLQTEQRAKWGSGSVFVAARGCCGNIPQGGQNWSLLAFPFGASPSTPFVAVT